MINLVRVIILVTAKKDEEVHRYVLGSKPKLKVTTTDTNGIVFIPSEIRLSVKAPTGEITTYSGMEMVTASGYMYVIYDPTSEGVYAYKGWAKDSGGLEDADERMFEVYDYLN